MKRICMLLVVLFCQTAFAWPQPGWFCQAEGVDAWGRRGFVQGGEAVYQEEAANSAIYACQYHGLRWCRVTNCYPAQGPYATFETVQPIGPEFDGDCYSQYSCHGAELGSFDETRCENIGGHSIMRRNVCLELN